MTNDLLLQSLIKQLVWDLNRLGCKVRFRKLLYPTGCFGYMWDNHHEIYIDKTKPLFTQYVVLIHERQHYLCEINGCFCMKSALFWAEYHAMKPEEFEILRLCGIRQSIDLAMADANRYVKLKWPVHLKALRRIFKLKQFRDAARKANCLRQYNILIKHMNKSLENLRGVENEAAKKNSTVS